MFQLFFEISTPNQLTNNFGKIPETDDGAQNKLPKKLIAFIRVKR